ncbi:MAG: PepSY domain-containing protein [Roseibium sp.]|uniref:PepSY domain-containing protein n=1 Tax=Roseibium sp. TaxID=1936156 RepID=UPI00262D39CE|nr:PepSY domain-containing protein [Roseibium sp.]MCV0428992.1 PepSY domain-containing protein [Roseibium sp.]
MKTPFKSSAVTLLSATGIVASTMAALAAVSVGDQLGTTEEDIRTALTSQGYTVEEFETEDGKLEAEVSKDGQELEVVVDAKSGLVLELELENEDDGDKDDD